LGAAVVDYHRPDWPEQAGGPFDAALIAASGTAQAAIRLVRDDGRLCSLTSDAPPPERGIRSSNLYVTPNSAQLEELAKLAAGWAARAPGGAGRARRGSRRLRPSDRRGHRRHKLVLTF
jgi:hypothetical protein